MTRRELIAKLGFEVDEKPLKKVEDSLEGIKAGLELLGAAEVIKGAIELVEHFAKFGEALHVAATSAGLTAEEFQKLSFAAGESAVSSEEMSTAMARLARNLYDARKGSVEAQTTFIQAGFSQQQIQGFKTSADVMRGLADRFKDIQDPIKKQALAQELLGRGSINMVGFLSQGSAAIGGLGDEAQKLGIVLSGGQVEAITKVEHALTKMGAVFNAIGATIVSYFAPSISSMINEFLKFYEVNRKVIDVNIRAWVYDVTYALGFLYGIVKFVVQIFIDWVSTHQLLARRLGEGVLILFAFGAAALSVIAAFGIFNTIMRAAGLAQLAFAAASWLAEAPIIAIVAAVGLAIVAFQALWTVLSGKSIKDSWIGQIGSFAGSGTASSILPGLGSIGSSLGNVASGALTSGAGALGLSGPGGVKGPTTINQYISGADPATVAAKTVDRLRPHLDTRDRRVSAATKSTEHY